jgi:hypothetical protein
MAVGCTVKTQIIEPDGSIYVIKSKSDSLVSVKSNDVDIIVDNRGKPNIFQSLLEFIFFKSSEITQIK